LTRPDRLRVAAAVAVSLLAHVALLSLLRLPPSMPAPPAGSRLSVLLIPVPGERRAESALRPAREAPAVARRMPHGDRERQSVAAQPGGAPETVRRRQPIVSAGPITAPRILPASRIADLAAYAAPEALTAYPAFAKPFEMAYPRRAYEEGRRGVVVVQVLIDEAGRVVEALAAPDSPDDFAEAALAGLRGARFRPGQAGGRPVKARAYFAVSFVIE
jgi:protein TonB